MIPFENLPEYVNAMDICLSTQTDDIIGWMRTTAKLPLYLAAGRYVLATDVGEAHYLLPSKMLISYNGSKDDGYPLRLAEKIRGILDNRNELSYGIENRNIAIENFDYKVLSKQLENSILEQISK